jgi:branched-chain amino acid transport system substrate-binding protein
MPTRCAAAAAIVAVLAGCGDGATPAGESGPVVIGILVDASAPAGFDAVSAARFAIDLVNDPHPDIDLPLAAGTGLPGRRGAPLVLAVGDSAGQERAAETAMGELVAEGAAGVVSAESAEVVAVAGAFADRRRVPLVDATTSAGFLLEVGLEWYFRTAPTDRMLAEAVFALLDLAQAPGGGRVTVLTPPGGSGADVVALLRELSRGAGFTATVTVADGEPTPAGAPPGILLAVAPEPADGDLLREVLAGPYASHPVVGIGPGLRSGPAGMLRPAAWSAELAARQPTAQAVLQRYEERHGSPMTEIAAAVFTATMALILAIDTAAGTDAAAVRAGLRQLSQPATQTIMPWNGVRFGENGQNLLAAAVVEQRTAAGNSYVVYPPEVAGAVVDWSARPVGVP